MSTTMINMRNQSIGQWLVLDRDPEWRPNGESRWWCQCACGTIRTVRGTSLRSGESRSCRKCQPGNYRHGHALSTKYDPTYGSWAGMIQRATKPGHANAANYIARGIGLDDPRWLDFACFYDDMGERPGGPQGSPDHHSLERLDNERGYSKANCVWATPLQQARNRRRRRTRAQLQALAA